MDGNWVAFIFIWAIAEGIQWIRKKELRQRMKTGAYWAVALVSLSAPGQVVKPDNTGFFIFLAFTTYLVLFGSAAAFIYWI